MRLWELGVEDGSQDTVVGASVALQSPGCRAVPGVQGLLHPKGAACRCVLTFGSHHSSWENRGAVVFFAGLSEERFSWSFVPLPNLPAPFGKGTAGETLPGSRREAAPGTIPAKTWELLL